MKLLSLRFLTIQALFLSLAGCSLDEDQFKTWRKYSKLSVDDFQAEAPSPEGREFDAWLFAGLAIEQQNGRPVVKAVIDRYNSWFDSTRNNARVLNHEVYHANLHLIFANETNRLIRQNHLDWDESTELTNKMSSKSHEVQLMYDADTKHSRDTLQQMRWQLRIDSILNGQLVFEDIEELQ
ncbi:hypothetical protein [Reichenbachiella ulvae]|uniref:Uncharacterized protein n=1 Tax=Reichenbachiella ulvae TaxID=2980104 RepID=A0ABT3CVE4_9BACT|nr:hypothetical protein [Reichenbachiella ulvae]MCV9387208.1 hypothetical protein [Reichenbachiella ulvae]